MIVNEMVDQRNAKARDTASAASALIYHAKRRDEAITREAREAAAKEFARCFALLADRVAAWDAVV